MAIDANVRRALAERSGGLCEVGIHGVCRGVGTDASHIKSRARGGSDRLENLRLSCRPCHDHIEQNKPGWKKHRAYSWQKEGEVAADLGED